MKSLLISKKFCLSLFILLFPHFAFCGSWILPKKQLISTEGMYYSMPGESENSIYLPGELDGFGQIINDEEYHIRSSVNRTASTFELKYGLSDLTTIFTKFDVGYVDANYKIEVLKDDEKSNYNFHLHYTSIEPYFGGQREIAKQDNKVVSLATSYYPGELINFKNNTKFEDDNAAVEARLMMGMGFEKDINFFNILGGAGTKRWHYFETQMALKKFLFNDNFQWDFQAHIGIRPAKKWLFVFGTYNTIFGSKYSKILSADEVNENFDGSSFTSAQELYLKPQLLEIFNAKQEVRSHQLNFKISHQIKPNKNISLEGLTSFLTDKPFKNNTIVLSYEKTF